MHVSGRKSISWKDLPRFWVWTGMAGAAGGMTAALAAMLGGASDVAIALCLGSSAAGLGCAAFAERRTRLADGPDMDGCEGQPECKGSGSLTHEAWTWVADLSAMQRATVLIADRQGGIDAASDSGHWVEPVGSLVDMTNVADRPQLLLALAQAGSVPRDLRLVMNATPWFEGGARLVRILARNSRCIVCVMADDPFRTSEDARHAAFAFAHDVRGPLAAVAGLADALSNAGAVAPAQREQYPALLARAARDAMALADGWLQNVEDVAPEICTLGEAMRTAMARHEATAGNVGAKLYLRCPSSLSPEPVDRRMTLQILSNLIGNALKHGGGELSVQLSASKVRGRIELEVKDNGCGMSDAAAVLAGRGIPAPTAGHGLGLTIVERLVAPRGGRLTIESAQGKGVGARVLLPRLQGDVEELAAVAPHTVSPALRADQNLDMNGGPHGPFKRTA